MSGDGPESSSRRYTFRPRHRLSGAGQFRAVFGARCSKARGPLVLHAVPNDLAHPRLGLSVGRRVGTAVKRHRIKRRLREAFRLMQHDWPRGYDVVVVVRPHEPLGLAEYQRLLFALMRDVHRQWEKRQAKARRRSEEGADERGAP